MGRERGGRGDEVQVVLPDAPRLDVAERHVVGRGQRLASGGEQLANVAETPAGFGDGVVERGPGFANTQMSDAHEPTAGGIVEMSRASREMCVIYVTFYACCITCRRCGVVRECLCPV